MSIYGNTSGGQAIVLQANNADKLDNKDSSEFAAASDVDALSNLVGDSAVSEQIQTALASAKSYTDTKTSSLASTYAGGTAVTLNGSSKAASTVSFYAPTSVGTSGYILKSSGSGAPTWLSTLPIANGGTGATTAATGLKNLLAAGNMVLSSYQYGSSLPSAGTAGRIFLKKVSS